MKRIERTIGYVFRPNGSMRMRVRWNEGKATYFSTGFMIDREKWDAENGRCLMNTVHGKKKIPAAVINSTLREMENKVDLVFYEFELKDHMPTGDEIQSAMKGDVVEGSESDFWKSMLEFMVEGESQHQWAYNTIKSIKQVKNLLKAFDSQLSFNKLTKEKLADFVKYQQKHKLSTKNFKNEEQGYSNAVIIKNCRILKWFLRWAAEKGYIDHEIERSFSPSLKTIDRPVIFLRWGELMDLYNFDFGDDALKAEARDFFCFCCFTSLRYSDAVALTKKQCRSDSIEVVTQKTSRLLKIELNKYSRAILERYKKRSGSKALPQVTNNALNQLLKKIGKDVGINEPISISQYYGGRRVDMVCPKYELMSSHCGRRTFICNALALGISPNIVMKWTGHSEYSAMKPYIDIADEIKGDEMRKFDKL